MTAQASTSRGRKPRYTLAQRRASNAAYIERVLQRAGLGSRPRIAAVEDVSPGCSGMPAPHRAECAAQEIEVPDPQ